MASRSSVAFCLVFLVASCLLLIEEAASTECMRTGHGCLGGEGAGFRGNQNRKMLVAGIEGKNNEVDVGTSGKLLQDEEADGDDDIMKGKNKLEVGSELRKVPSGPDPLHHNGNAPKKPRTDP